ncbi:MAG: hypothetical protein EPO07_18500 [Verrucomicrobia bacterium]|nr:MAG: hypothetical protein EPO07_18500 [Verrucomicrobiota bacterium]
MASVTNNPTRLEMRGVRRSFGATKALRGGELTVAPGEVMALGLWSAVTCHRFPQATCRRQLPVAPKFGSSPAH